MLKSLLIIQAWDSEITVVHYKRIFQYVELAGTTDLMRSVAGSKTDGSLKVMV